MRRPTVSAAVWIPIFLLLILGSRPISLWLSGGGGYIGEMGNEVAANPFDQLFYLVVIAGSFLIASMRGVKWQRLFATNPVIMLFYTYFLISVMWSGDPSGSLKRLLKDFGLLFVISVLYSEKNPMQAIRAVFLRCAFVLIPLSVVFVKFFPQYSKAYSIGGNQMVTGVTTQKNSLGEIILIFTLFMVWDQLETMRPGVRSWWRQVPWERVVILLMGIWLLNLSQSKTALLCTLVGAFLIARTGWFASRTVSRAALSGAISLPFLVFFSQQFSSVVAPLIQALGRDMTFTGRTNIWQHVTLQTVNPLIGSGYWNFWGGPGGAAINRQMDTIVPNAHNGYVDIYLDGGFVGIALLFLVLIVCGRRIVSKQKGSREEKLYRRVRLSVLVVAVIYNLSESTFARMGPMWFTTMLMIVEFPAEALVRKIRPTARKESDTLRFQKFTDVATL